MDATAAVDRGPVGTRGVLGGRLAPYGHDGRRPGYSGCSDRRRRDCVADLQYV